MKKIFKLLVALIGFSILSAYAGKNDLPEVKDIYLVHLLNDFELVAEIKDMPVSVRILRLKDHGECDGSPPTCPKEILYIAVSNFDEAPDQKLYRLPMSNGWKFVKWKSVPKKEGVNHFVVFEAEEKNASGKKGRTKKYEIGVNPWKGYATLSYE